MRIMNIFRFFLIFSTFICSAMNAQDIILKTNGEELQVKVTEVSTDVVKYKKFSNLTGPVYVIQNIDIFMIKYEDGNKDLFEKNSETGKISIRQIVKPNPEPPAQTPVQEKPDNVPVPQESKPAPVASPEPTDAKAQFQLGQKYEKGDGVTQNNQKAADWYSKAAEQGHADAQYHLGILCATVKTLAITTKEDFQMRNGVFVNTVGLTIGPATALFWWKKAAEQGHVGAKAKIQEMEAANKPAAQTPSPTSTSKNAQSGSLEEQGVVYSVESVRTWASFDGKTPAEKPYEKWRYNGPFSRNEHRYTSDQRTPEGKFVEIVVWFENKGEEEASIDMIYDESDSMDCGLLYGNKQTATVKAFVIPGTGIARNRMMTEKWKGSMGFRLKPEEKTWILLLFDIPVDASDVKLQMKKSTPVSITIP